MALHRLTETLKEDARGDRVFNETLEQPPTYPEKSAPWCWGKVVHPCAWTMGVDNVVVNTSTKGPRKQT